MKRLILTYNQSCNLSCDFCYVSFHHKKIRDLSILITKRAIELGFNIITFGGGDAFSKKYFREACRISKENGLITHVDTNCIAIKKSDYDFIKNYIDILGVSLDGIGEIHNQMRKSFNLFTKVEETLKILNELNIKIKINTVATKQNKDNINYIYQYLNGFDNISIWSIYQFFPLDAAKRHQSNFEISNEEFDKITEFTNSKLANFNIEKFKFIDRVDGYIFSDEEGNIYTNNMDGNYYSIGSIFENDIMEKLKSLNINPKVSYRYELN